MTAADRILPLLSGVRLRNDNRWIARCPAHDDRSPSLSIRYAKDRVLLHCWVGCPPDAIAAALDLTLADLYDEDGRERRRDPAAERKRRAAEGLRHWRDAETQRCAESLRARDTLVGALDKAVRDGTIAEDQALESLEYVYRGYSDLEYKFDRLLHNENFLDLWRESRR